MSSIVDNLQAKGYKQIPKLNGLKIKEQNGSILQASQEQWKLKEYYSGMIDKLVGATKNSPQQKHYDWKNIRIYTLFFLGVERLDYCWYNFKTKD